MNSKQRLASVLAAAGTLFLVVGYWIVAQPTTVVAQDLTWEVAQADETDETASVPADTIEPTGDNSFCLTCHLNSDETKTLEDGTALHVGVDMEELTGSAHAELGCIDCHGADAFPHDDPYPETGRAYTVQKALTCTGCHTDHTENLADDVHYTALANGNLRSASCVDCHGAHDVQPLDASLTQVSQTCGDCHTTTFTEYRDSIHGVALFDGDENAPTCVSCHGVHAIQHPTTAQFRNRSPQLCATCHADAELMEQYDISTNVFDSYITDFHGTTVSLFAQTDPNVPTNKAVCTDCHGVHDITAADDTKSQVVRENLLVTCQECHPGASADFPDSWVGHFEPTFESHPILTAVNIFYDVLIPVVLIGFAVLIAIDIIGRIRRRFSNQGAHA